MNKDERWCSEDALENYLGILIEHAQDEGSNLQRDTLYMLSLVSIAYSLDYIEHRLVQILRRLEKEPCKS